MQNKPNGIVALTISKRKSIDERPDLHMLLAGIDKMDDESRKHLGNDYFKTGQRYEQLKIDGHGQPDFCARVYYEVRGYC